MSYVRWSSESDVYVYADVRGGYTLAVNDGQSFNFKSKKEMTEKLLSLKSIGNKVPQYAIDAFLEKDD